MVHGWLIAQSTCGDLWAKKTIASILVVVTYPEHTVTGLLIRPLHKRRLLCSATAPIIPDDEAH